MRAPGRPYLLPRPARSGSRHLDQLGRLDRLQVSAGGGEAGVSELKLDVPHAHPLAQQLGRVGVAQRVWVQAALDSGLRGQALHERPHFGIPDDVVNDLAIKLKRKPGGIQSRLKTLFKPDLADTAELRAAWKRASPNTRVSFVKTIIKKFPQRGIPS